MKNTPVRSIVKWVRRLATTAHAILGLLALRPRWSSTELTHQLRRNMRFFWPRAESRIYDEAKALVGRGWADAERTHVGRRPRTTYSITDAGRRELREWLASAPRPSALSCEPLLRVFLADLSTREELDAALARIRADAEEILSVGRVVGPEYLEGRAPFQDQVHVRALVFDFLTSHALMLRAWADRAEAAIDAWPSSDERAREVASRASIAALLAEYPAPPAG
jgi:PadR family transcriptional regulator, regulatory protein AphA